jgi:hypothetical protein
MDYAITESPALIAVFDQTMTCIELSRRWREHLELDAAVPGGVTLEDLFGPCDDNSLEK